jgi:phosphoenolpyruvate synthase/pyruvate phosphate dikinase
MKLLTAEKIKSIIKKHDLRLAISRHISFFLNCCIARGYTTEMTKRFGFSYRAIAIKGRGPAFTDYLNIVRLSKEMDKFLEKHPGNEVEKILNNCINEFEEIKSKTQQAEKLIAIDPLKTLKMISDLAVPYFGIIGFYNVFWRYLDVGKNLPESLIRRISRERDLLANLYPHLDQLLSECGKIIGGQQGFDGNLICFFTPEEMRQFIKTRRINSKQLSELAKRRNLYFYLFTEDGEETILTEPAVIENICAACFPETTIPDREITELKGQCAYPGKARGKVYKLSPNVRPPKNFILVTNMTHPKDIMYVKKSSAVITDEGSILCHAAVACRELKKPCVVGTKIATKVLKDGDLVEVDAEKGIVKKV